MTFSLSVDVSVYKILLSFDIVILSVFHLRVRVLHIHEKMKCVSLTSHQDAAVFRSQEAEPELPDLFYKDKKDLEKLLVILGNYAGSVGHVACARLSELRDKLIQYNATFEEYDVPDIRIDDPVGEIVSILTTVRDDLIGTAAKDLMEIVRMIGVQFNQILIMRRNFYLGRVTQSKNARAVIKKIPPSDEYLFSGKVGEVTRNLKDAQSLNPLSIREGGFKTHNKGTFKTKQGFKKQGFKKPKPKDCQALGRQKEQGLK